MQRISRRTFLNGVGAGLAAGAFTPLLGTAFRGAAGGSESEDPHHFLLITFPEPSGLDASYLFDARPWSMTADKLIQNYRKSGEPERWSSETGSCLFTEVVKPLVPYRKYFSVVNGVTMAVGFNGHRENVNFTLAGRAFGGDSFVPLLNSSLKSKAPIDAVLNESLEAEFNNFGNAVPMDAAALTPLVAGAKRASGLRPDRGAYRFLASRLADLGNGSGAFARGASGMRSGLEGAPDLARRLSQVVLERSSGEVDFIRMLRELFVHGAVKSGILVMNFPKNQLDSHDFGHQSDVPSTYLRLTTNLAAIFEAMRSTPYDGRRSMFDVTTVLVASEFGRTMRQIDQPIDGCGTDHNPLTNSVFLAGKGIRGGQVIGSSDFQLSNEILSKAHLALDPQKIKTMGRPFDFDRGVSRTDLPEEYRPRDYLGFASVINTIHSLFGVERKHWLLTEPGGPRARVLSGLTV